MTQIKSLDELKGLDKAFFVAEVFTKDADGFWIDKFGDEAAHESNLSEILDIKNWHYHVDDDICTLDNDQTKRLMDSYRRILAKYDADKQDKKLKEVNEFLEDSE